MTAASVFGRLLDKVLGGSTLDLTDDECKELADKLDLITKDGGRPGDERNAASLLLASLEARRSRVRN